MKSTTTAVPAFTPKQEANSVAQSERWVVIDYLRGIAMLLMALDHSTYFAKSDMIAESYDGFRPMLGTLPHTLLGLITNIASGTFFALAGVSIGFLEASRRKRGWTEWKICRFLLIRAAIIFILDRTLVSYAFDVPPTFDVLSAMAFCLVILAFVRLLPLRVVGILAISTFLLYPILVNLFPYNPQQPLSAITTILFQWHPNEFPFVEFPLFGRLSLVLGGYVIGRLLQERKLSINLSWLWAAGIGITIAFILRLLGGYGNFLPFQHDWPLIYFFIENKQPPSVVFLLWNLSLSTILLVVLNQFRDKIFNTFIQYVMRVFGQTALFFYVVHLFLYGRIISRIVPPTFLLHLGLMRAFLEFVVGIIILFPLCLGYRHLRQRYPNSILHYL